MSYFDLLGTLKYFDIFLKHFNSEYARRGQKRENHYGGLIRRHYKIGQGGIGNPSVYDNHVAGLINNNTHINDVYESLLEFGIGKRGAKRVPFNEFWNSVQANKQVLVRLIGYRMDSIAPNAVPQSLLGDLELLFYGLRVVPPDKPRKLVAVSKTLHFLLPGLVMPVDGASVLRFLNKGNVPDVSPKMGRQFDLFKEVFFKYIEITTQLKLKPDNGDGNWWNIAVPKRIDNAIAGFWEIFDNANTESIICGHIDMLLSYLGMSYSKGPNRA